MPRIRKTPASVDAERFARTPEGYINNCSLAFGDVEATCQVCNGKCPDAQKYAEAGLTPPPVTRLPAKEADEAEELVPDPEVALDEMFRGRGTAPARKAPTMGPALDRIVDSTFAIDFESMYERVHAALKPLASEDRTATFGEMAVALDESQERAREAHLLYINAKVALSAFEADAGAIEGAIREVARETLEEKRRDGKLSKAPTKDDIEAEMATAHNDEWADLRVKRERAKRTVEHLERVAELARDRIRALQAMVSVTRV